MKIIYDKKFNLESNRIINNLIKKKKLQKASRDFNIQASINKYTYNFNWLGVPVIQYPQDLQIMQEIIFDVKPDLIIETGVARGGSLIFYSSILSLIKKRYKVIGVDLDIRKHAKKVLTTHPFAKKITTFQGSSVDFKIFNQIKKISKKFKKIMVCLDSDHTHDHVLKEMELYKDLVTKNSYMVVFDTTQAIFPNNIINKIKKTYAYKPWGKNSNPLTAIKEFLKTNNNFKIIKSQHEKLLITNCYKGFLKKK